MQDFIRHCVLHLPCQTGLINIGEIRFTNEKTAGKNCTIGVSVCYKKTGVQ